MKNHLEVPITVFSPAKINLYLAVTGQLEDGFHDLVSLVCPVQFGDYLHFNWNDDEGGDRLTCDDPAIPTDDRNLVLQALQSFREKVDFTRPVRIMMEKRIPSGAGLGGGSSNATFTLLSLNRMAGNHLDRKELHEMAAPLGADCPLFLYPGPVVMRGKGEVIEPLPNQKKFLKLWNSIRLLLVKPFFTIDTVDAYDQLKKTKPCGYVSRSEAELGLSALLDQPLPCQDSLFNSFENPFLHRYPGMALLMTELRSRFGLPCLLSGSGSAFFVCVPDGRSMDQIQNGFTDALGDPLFMVETRLKTQLN